MHFNKSERQLSSHKLNVYYKFRKTIFFKKKQLNYFFFSVSDVFCILTPVVAKISPFTSDACQLANSHLDFVGFGPYILFSSLCHCCF